MKLGPCPYCRSDNVKDEVVTEPLLYGALPAQVELTVTQPVIYCTEPGCGERWTDWRGEEARAKVTEALLHSAPDLAVALLQCLKLIDDLMPGIRHLALQDYKIVNDAPWNAGLALRKAGVKQ